MSATKILDFVNYRCMKTNIFYSITVEKIPDSKTELGYITKVDFSKNGSIRSEEIVFVMQFE